MGMQPNFHLQTREFQVLSSHVAGNNELLRKHLSLQRQNFPLTINYGEKTYVLVLTRSGKLLLQKPFEESSR
jgi:hemin uptake protein HemP